MSNASNKGTRQKVLTLMMAIIGGLALLGFTVIPAAIEIMKSLNADPTKAAVTASPQSDLDAQARGYELVLQREPNNQTALRGLLEIRIQQQNVKGAIAPLEKLAELNPQETDYVVLLAQAKQQTGDREGAAQSYRSVLSSNPGNLNALKGLVALLLEQRRPEAAIGLLEDTLKTADEANQVKPNSVEVPAVQLLLASVYADVQRSEDALAIYNEIIEADPNDFRPVLGKAMVLQNQGKTDEARILFSSAAALAPAQYKDQINQLAKGPSPVPPAAGTTAPPTGAAPFTSPANTPGTGAPATSSPPSEAIPDTTTAPGSDN